MEWPNGMQRVFAEPQIYALLNEAVSVVERVAPKDDLRVPLLNAAINLVGQFQMPGASSGIAVPTVRTEGRML